MLLGLGEVVLRVRDLDGMQRFYQDVFGLTLLRPRRPHDDRGELICHDASLRGDSP